MAKEWSRLFMTRSQLRLLVRRAEHSDYQAVIDIDKDFAIYGGYDYIPDYYHEILQTPNVYGFVGIFRDRIVAFSTYHMIERGTVMLSCAARMVNDQRSVGLFNDFSKLAGEILLDHFPQLRKHVWTGVMWESYLKLAAQPKPPLIILNKWNGIKYDHLECSKVEKMIKHIRSGLKVRKSTFDASLMTKNEFSQLFQSPVALKKLFPAGTIYAGRNVQPFDLTTSDPRDIYEIGDTYGVFEGNEKTVRGIGLVVHHLAPENKLCCYMYYYGEDMDGLMTMFLKALDDVLKHAVPTKRISGIGLHYPLTIRNTEILSQLDSGVKPVLGLGTQLAHMQSTQFPV